MARFGFFGLSTGDSVRLTAGAREAQTGPEGWGANGPKATIQVHRSDLQVAPEGMNFEVVLENFDTPGPSPATGTYDPQFHDIYYVWNFGDPGKTYDKPEYILPEHRDANIAYGPLATHVYDVPGTYTVTVDIIEPESGKTAQATLDVTVGDPDSQFLGFRTLYVDPDGDFSGAPAGAQLFDDLQAAFERTGQTTSDLDYFRIMLNRGKEYPDFIGAQMRSNWKNVYWCAGPGNAARPIVHAIKDTSVNRLAVFEDRTGFGSPGKMTDITFSGIEFVGVWDSQIEEPVDGLINLVINRINRCTSFLMNDCICSGFGTMLADQSVFPPTNVPADAVDVHLNIVSDTTITNWQNFGIYADIGSSHGIVGCSIVQDVLALSGGGKGIGHNEHGPVRIQVGKGQVVDACDMFSRNGWFPNTVGMHTPQPGFRWNQLSDPEAKLNMQRTFAEAPNMTLALTALGSDEPVACNGIVDKCHVIGGYFGQDVISILFGGLTVRNSVIIQPEGDRTMRGTLKAAAWIKVETRADTTPEAINAPIRAYNNTFIDWSSPDETKVNGELDIFQFIGSTPFANVTEVNNLRYRPNSGETPHAIDTEVLFTARYTDYRDRFNPVQDTMPSDVVPGQSMFVPYSHFPGGFSRADFTESSADVRYQPELYAKSHQAPEDFSFSFNETGITITNTGTDTWTNGSTRIIVPVMAQPYVRPEFGSGPGSIIRAAPTPDSTAVGAALSGLTAMDDMLGRIRPAYPSIGAYELP